MLKELVGRCAESDVTLLTTPQLTEAIVQSGYSATFGARPLRRAVQRLCEDAVAEAMLGGFVSAGETLELDAGGKPDEIVLKCRGKKRVHEASSAQGIEDDSGATGAVEPTGVTTRVTKPANSL